MMLVLLLHLVKGCSVRHVSPVLQGVHAYTFSCLVWFNDSALVFTLSDRLRWTLATPPKAKNKYSIVDLIWALNDISLSFLSGCVLFSSVNIV